MPTYNGWETGTMDQMIPGPKRTITTEAPGWRDTGGIRGFSSDTPILGNDTGVGAGGALAGASIYGCLILDFSGTAGQLTSTDTSAGDMLQSTKGSVEFWFKKTANPAGNNQVWLGPDDTGSANAIWYWDLLTTGVVQFNTRNTTPAVKTVASAALNPNQWYHLVGVKDGTNLILYVNGVNVASTGETLAWPKSTTTGNLMRVQNPGTGTSVSFAEMAVYPAIALSPGRVLAHYQAGTARGFSQCVAAGPATTDTRVTDVLDTVDSFAPRNMGPVVGAYSMPARYMAGDTALDACREVVTANAPDGMFFCSKSGTLTFLSANHRTWAPYNATQMVFDDDGTDNPYWELQQGQDESTLANTWSLTVARNGYATQTVTDATSKARYFERPVSITGLPLGANTEAASMAAAYLAKYKDPLMRFPAISPDMSNPATITAALDRELGDRVQILRRPLGGGLPVSQVAYIQSVQETGAPGVPLQLEFGVSPV